MHRILCLICCLALALSFAGCSEKKEDNAVTLQLNWKPEPQFGGFYAADVNGSFKKHGLNVTINPGGAGAPTIEMLGSGKVPFAIVSADEIPRARQLGAKVVALFAVYQTHPQGIMTRASRGFTDIGDVFKNPGTLAMEQGLPYSNFLKKKYGFDKLKIVPSPFGDLSLYRTDANYAMQCFVTSEPLAAREIGIEPKTFLIAESGFNPYATVLATNEDYLAKHPDLVKKMVAAVGEGWRTYLDDPAKTNEAMAKLNPGMTPKTFVDSAQAQKALIETDETKSKGLGSMTPERWGTLLNQLSELKVIDKPVTPGECYRWPL